MSTARKFVRLMTSDEYAIWERSQTERHEYFNGEVFCQARGTRRHSLIGTNVLGEVRAHLKGQSCQAYGSDMRVNIKATGYQAYPDVSVVCPPFGSDFDEVIDNPVLLVEVLSPSTADFDRGTKFAHYRQLPSLIEYLVIWQDQARVEQHTRTAQGDWLLREHSGLEKSINLASVGLTLSLHDIYDKVEFDA